MGRTWHWTVVSSSLGPLCWVVSLLSRGCLHRMQQLQFLLSCLPFSLWGEAPVLCNDGWWSYCFLGSWGERYFRSCSVFVSLCSVPDSSIGSFRLLMVFLYWIESIEGTQENISLWSTSRWQAHQNRCSDYRLVDEKWGARNFMASCLSSCDRAWINAVNSWNMGSIKVWCSYWFCPLSFLEWRLQNGWKLDENDSGCKPGCLGISAMETISVLACFLWISYYCCQVRLEFKHGKHRSWIILAYPFLR